MRFGKKIFVYCGGRKRVLDVDKITIGDSFALETLDLGAKVYKENIIIISSRQNNSFRGLGNQFEELELRPFSKDQAIDMIKKLDY